MTKVIRIVCLALVILAGQSLAQTAVHIPRFTGAQLGQNVYFDISLQNTSGIELGGFDLLVEPHEGLTLHHVSQGAMIAACDWEYFTYSLEYGSSLRLVAMADINNGGVHPFCFGAEGGVLAHLGFEIGTDPGLEEEYLWLKFRWYDCGDNSLANRPGDSLYISSQVFDFDGYSQTDITSDDPFPTGGGAPSLCGAGGSGNMVRSVTFYNGGVAAFVPDTFPPVAQCPADTTVSCDPGECGTTVSFQAAVSDNRPGASISCSPASGGWFAAGQNEVTCIAIDSAGNSDTCSFTITVVDTQPPTLILPETIIQPADSGECGANVLFQVAAEDNCGIATTNIQPAPGSMFPVGTTYVRCIAIDLAYRSTLDSFQVIVHDAEPPSATCPPDRAVPNDPDDCGAVVTYSVVADDNCESSGMCQPPSGTFFPIGSTDVVGRVVDRFGHSDSCLFSVIVSDTQPPVLTPVNDISVPAEPGECGAHVSFIGQAIDNCMNVSVISSHLSGSFFPVGTTTVAMVATDIAGLADSTEFTVAVIDQQAPSLVCPDTIRVSNDSGLYGSIVEYAPTVNDNCPQWEMSLDPPSGSFFEAGVHSVLASVTDRAGWVDSCRFTVIVELDDLDGDGLPDFDDNCPGQYNPGQVDSDGDATGDACDNCPDHPNPDQFDTDSDQLGDVCDNCPETSNPEQVDQDSDETGDACDPCPLDPDNDIDQDGHCADQDNCPETNNPDQADADEDGIGDSCCCTLTGDVDHDTIGPDISDLVYLVSYMFGGGLQPPCPPAADIDGNAVGPDIADLVYLVSYMFGQGPPPVPCQ